MTPPRRRTKPRQARGGKAAAPVEFWAAVAEPDVPADIAPARDPTALLRSLGPPPLPGQAGADQYLAAVVERASGLATALAAAADLLAAPNDDEDDEGASFGAAPAEALRTPSSGARATT